MIHALPSISIYNSETLFLGFHLFTRKQMRSYAPQTMLCYLPAIVVRRISDRSGSVSADHYGGWSDQDHEL